MNHPFTCLVFSIAGNLHTPHSVHLLEVVHKLILGHRDFLRRGADKTFRTQANHDSIKYCSVSQDASVINPQKLTVSVKGLDEVDGHGG